MTPHECGRKGGCLPLKPKMHLWPKEELMAEIDFMLAAGESIWAISEALDRPLLTLERTAYKANRPDIATLVRTQITGQVAVS